MLHSYKIEVHKWNNDLGCYLKEWETPEPMIWTWGGIRRAKMMASKVAMDAGYFNHSGNTWCKQPSGWAKLSSDGHIIILKVESDDNPEISTFTKDFGSKMVTD